MIAPAAAIDVELSQARGTIERARATLAQVRRGKTPRRDAEIIHDLFGPAVKVYRAISALPESAPWRQDYERIADDMEVVRGEASKFSQA